jgi:hypothetical protein
LELELGGSDKLTAAQRELVKRCAIASPTQGLSDRWSGGTIVITLIISLDMPLASETAWSAETASGTVPLNTTLPLMLDTRIESMPVISPDLFFQIKCVDHDLHIEIFNQLHIFIKKRDTRSPEIFSDNI